VSGLSIASGLLVYCVPGKCRYAVASGRAMPTWILFLRTTTWTHEADLSMTDVGQSPLDGAINPALQVAEHHC
jgi:hypothetical protein